MQEREPRKWVALRHTWLGGRKLAADLGKRVRVVKGALVPIPRVDSLEHLLGLVI